MYPVYLVRHGQSEGQASNYVHDAATPLSLGGQRQIRSLLPFLKEQKITRVFTSPFRRAIDSAAIISKALGIAYEIDVDFGEWNYGAFEGSWEEHRQIYPQLFIQSGCFDPEFKAGDGESFNEFVTRVKNRAERLHETQGPNSAVLIVSHFCALNIITNTLLHIPTREEFYFDFANGSVSRVTLRPDFPPRLSYSNRIFY